MQQVIHRQAQHRLATNTKQWLLTKLPQQLTAPLL